MDAVGNQFQRTLARVRRRLRVTSLRRRDQDEQLVDERETLRRADTHRHVRQLQQRQQLLHERRQLRREDTLLRLQRHQQHPAGGRLRHQGKELRGRRVTGLRGLRVREDGRQEGHELVLHLVGRVVDVQEDRRRVQAIDRHLLVLGRSHRLHQRVVAHAVHRGRVYVTNRRETYPDRR